MMRAAIAIAEATGIDTVAILTPAKLAELRGIGHSFAVRYVPFGGSSTGGWDVTRHEVEHILAAGMVLMLVQRCRVANWTPSALRGKGDGERAADYALALGYPAGATIWCDLEGVSLGVPPDETIGHVNAWSTAVSAVGYSPGLYVGWQCGLTSAQLYHRLGLARYWRSASAVPEVQMRGYCMRQSVEQIVAGLRVDMDTIQADHLGGLPIWAMEK